MGLETPVRGAVHTGGGEGGEAQLSLAGGDVLGHLLQVGKGLDVIHRVTGLGQQGLVDDDAVGLDDVGNAQGGVAVFQGIGVRGQLAQDVGTGQIIAVVLPVGQTHGAVDLEEGGGSALGNLAHQGLLIGAGGGGDHGDGHAGLLGVGLGQVLPGLVLLGLEVQVVNGAGSCGSGGSAFTGGSGGLGLAAAAGGQKADAKREGQQKRKYFFHLNTPFPFIGSIRLFIFTSSDAKIRCMRPRCRRCAGWCPFGRGGCPTALPPCPAECGRPPRP